MKTEMSWTAVAERIGDTAFERTKRVEFFYTRRAGKSSVALRFPPQSRTLLRPSELNRQSC